MTMQTAGDDASAIDRIIETETDDGARVISAAAVAVLNRSEVEAQLDAAHRYPRSTRSFLQRATELATMSREVADSCIYALPRGGKTIAGPSVRLAEIVASAWGNMHIGSRIVDIEEREIVAQGVAWDLEANLRIVVETRRRITGKNGRRYDDDMITMTGNAGASIALRNAIFRVIPRAYVNGIYLKAREVAVGNASTFAARRAEVVARLQKLGVPLERIFARVDRAGIEDLDQEDLAVLIGLGSAVKETGNVDSAFPPVVVAPSAPASAPEEGRRVKLSRDKKGPASAATAPPPALGEPAPPLFDPVPEREPVPVAASSASSLTPPTDAAREPGSEG